MSGWRVHHLVVMVLLYAGLFLALGWAQDTEHGDQQTIPLLLQQIKDLQLQYTQLQRQVNVLETKQAQDASASETAAAVTDSSQQVDTVPGAVQAWHDAHGHAVAGLWGSQPQGAGSAEARIGDERLRSWLRGQFLQR